MLQEMWCFQLAPDVISYGAAITALDRSGESFIVVKWMEDMRPILPEHNYSAAFGAASTFGIELHMDNVHHGH